MPARKDSEEIDVDDVPTSIDPYTVLDITKDADEDAVKKAYRKAALKHHPDKAAPEDKETANTRFQEIAFAYAILSDARRRKRYDATGRTEESLDLDDDDFDWVSFYREQFSNVITGESITNFTNEYKGSEEERAAILAAYTKGKGAMSRVYSEVMTSNPATDDARFRNIIREAIKKREVEAFDKFTKETEKSIRARIRQAEREGVEAEEHAKDIGVHDKVFGGSSKKAAKKDSGEGDLAALIQQRQKGRAENFLADLEAKYAPAEKKGKKRAEPFDEPSEEMFERNAKKGKKTADDNGNASTGARKSKRSKA